MKPTLSTWRLSELTVIQHNEKQVMGTEVLDIVEAFNIAKFIPRYAQEPFHAFFEQYRHEIEDFSRVS